MGCRPVAVVIMHVHKYEIKMTLCISQNTGHCYKKEKREQLRHTSLVHLHNYSTFIFLSVMLATVSAPAGCLAHLRDLLHAAGVLRESGELY